MSSSLPTIIRAQISCVANANKNKNDDNNNNSNTTDIDSIGIHIKRCHEHESAIIIYHVDTSLVTNVNIITSSSSSNNHNLKNANNHHNSSQNNNIDAADSDCSFSLIGCELLAINNNKVSTLKMAEELLCQYASKNDGKVDILVSNGKRPRGSLYLISKLHLPLLPTVNDDNNDDLLPQCSSQRLKSEYSKCHHLMSSQSSILTDCSNCSSSSQTNIGVIGGLELEETNSRVRILGCSSQAGEVEGASHNNNNNNGNEARRRRRSSGTITTTKPNDIFTGLRFNKGDFIMSVNGQSISSIQDVQEAICNAVANKEDNNVKEEDDDKVVLVPILTYNIFRRLKSTVMTTIVSTRGVNAFSLPASEGNNNNRVNIYDTYTIQEKLGEGAFAIVKKAIHRQTNETYAIKIVNRSSLNKDIEAALKDEIMILRIMEHEHIMKLENVVVSINHYYLVAEYLEGGELFERIVDKETYTEKEARDVCHSLFSALSYTHSKGIVHRDLKPENLLLKSKKSDLEIKIADFGFAKQAQNDHSLSTMCGTPGYVAPEILRKEKYGTKADMWSMGVIIFIMLGGYPPFYADSPRQLLRLSKAGKFHFDPEYWGDISDGVKDMISSLLVTSPEKRLSADEALKHSWMNESTSNLRRSSLAKTQIDLKKWLARRRFKMAIHSILFVNTFSGANAVFSGRCKRSNIKSLEKDSAEGSSWSDLSKKV